MEGAATDTCCLLHCCANLPPPFSDKSKSLDKTEFCNLMMILLSNIFSRVLFQFLMTIILVPLAAPVILAYVMYATAYVTALDSNGLITSFQTWHATVLAPHPLYAQLLSYVPATIGVTVVGSVLITVIVPNVLETIDDVSMAISGWSSRPKVKAN